MQMPQGDLKLGSFMFATFLMTGYFFYFVVFWFVREPLKKLYYIIDKRRIDFERTAEMDEILEEEAHVKEMVGEDDSRPTPDFVHMPMTSRQLVAEKSTVPAQWNLEMGSKPTKKFMREERERLEENERLNRRRKFETPEERALREKTSQ